MAVKKTKICYYYNYFSWVWLNHWKIYDILLCLKKNIQITITALVYWTLPIYIWANERAKSRAAVLKILMSLLTDFSPKSITHSSWFFKVIASAIKLCCSDFLMFLITCWEKIYNIHLINYLVPWWVDTYL